MRPAPPCNESNFKKSLIEKFGKNKDIEKKIFANKYDNSKERTKTEPQFTKKLLTHDNSEIKILTEKYKKLSILNKKLLKINEVLIESNKK